MDGDHQERRPLKMVSCRGCGAKVFIPGELAPLSTTPCSKCAHPLMMPMQLRQFELRDAIASGGMGTVYRAWDCILHREVAVKLMKEDLIDDAKAFDDFLREARAAASLNHTNIIHIHTFEEHDSLRYLVMELADRGSLDSRIEREVRLPELEVLDIGIKVASALDTALKHKLLHRDIKPGNILFNAEGEPKLVDFGLARSTEAESEGDTTVWGTPYYIAPEKVRREREDFLSDLYSLAGTLYHAITGHVPFEAPTVDEVVAAHMHEPVTPPHRVVAGISQATSDALVMALAKKPSARYHSYDEFIMALTAARSLLLVHQLKAGKGSGPGGVFSSWLRR
jgi:eukaryotic-like serine/threonine-protein kinase